MTDRMTPSRRAQVLAAVEVSAAPGTLRGSRRITGWRRCDRGVAAVEFALVAPILAFMLLAGVDMGRAIAERMAMDHALRAGAQESMKDPGAARVLEVMQDTAASNFPLDESGAGTGDTPLSLSAVRFCACPEDTGFAVACSTICAQSEPTFTYYRMAGEKSYTGWIMPAFGVDRTVQVQVR